MDNQKDFAFWKVRRIIEFTIRFNLRIENSPERDCLLITCELNCVTTIIILDYKRQRKHY